MTTFNIKTLNAISPVGLQRLVRARLLLSVQGTRGGYALSRAATSISVADVIQAIDGPLTVTACSTTPPAEGTKRSVAPRRQSAGGALRV